MYGSSMYGGGYGSSMYGGGGGMYGGGMYGSGMYGGGMYSGGPGAPPGFEAPPAPPSAWQAALGAIGGVVHFFGRLSFLVDENAHAVHFFVSALLQLLDRAGSLYGELARFILRVVFKRRPPPKALAGPPGQQRPPVLPPRPGFGAPGSGAPWQAPAAPALPPPGSGSPFDLPSGSHWDSLWGDG
jgi:peroxin-13